MQHAQDRAFRHPVDGVGGLVEDENCRLAQKRARQTDPLPLPAGKTEAAEIRLRLVAPRKGADKSVGVRQLCGLAELLECGGLVAVADVVGDGPVNQVDVLPGYTDLAPPIRRVDLGEDSGRRKRPLLHPAPSAGRAG